MLRPMQATPVKAGSSNLQVAPGMRRWVVLGLLTVGIIIAYVARINFSVALAAPDFKALFHLTDSDRGLRRGLFLVLRAAADSGRHAGGSLRRQVPLRAKLFRMVLDVGGHVTGHLHPSDLCDASRAGRRRIGSDSGEHALDPVPLPGKRAGTGDRVVHGRHQVRSGHRGVDCRSADPAAGMESDVPMVGAGVAAVADTLAAGGGERRSPH